MSERIRKSAKTSFLASKRLVISACAAIAMVLGAASSGASFIPNSGATPQSNTDKILEEDGTATQVKEGVFNKQHAIEAQNLVTTPTAAQTTEKHTTPTSPTVKTTTPSFLTTTQTPRDVIASDTAAGGNTTSTPPATTTTPSDTTTTTPTDQQPSDNPTSDDTNPPKQPSDNDTTDPTPESLSANNQSTQQAQ